VAAVFSIFARLERKKKIKCVPLRPVNADIERMIDANLNHDLFRPQK